MSRCYELRGCPASQYLNCEAYTSGLRCYQVPRPRCTKDLLFCMQMGCPAYNAWSSEIDAEMRSRAMETAGSRRGEEAEF